MAPYRHILALCAVFGTLSACGDREPVVSTPPAAWVEPVPEPTVPAGNSDEEVANYIVSLVDAMRAANNKLQRLKDWREGIED